MNIPKELVGKVEKFEDCILMPDYDKSDFGGEDPFELCKNILDKQNQNEIIRDFYRQPFTPEMIEKYFEGWRYSSTHGLYYIEPENEPDYMINIQEYSLGGFQLLTYNLSVEREFFIIKTLSDFIDACKNSEIELTWRQT